MEIESKVSIKKDEAREKSKTGRKNKEAKENKNEDKEENKNGQDKFFIDVRNDQEAKEMVGKLLSEADNRQLTKGDSF